MNAIQEDAMRWRWLVRYASLGYMGVPSYDTIIRLPVFDSADTTITEIVDSGRRLYGEASL